MTQPPDALVFLDFDGVTHPRVGTAPFTPECMDALAQAIAPFELSIVITSTWREDKPLEELNDILIPLGKPLEGITPVRDDPFLQHVRYHEVMAYLTNTNQEGVRWLAIDDTPGFYPPEAPVYWTDPKRGFVKPDIDKFSAFFVSLK